MYRVFVYGTLKKGQPNHKVIESAVKGIHKCLGNGVTVAKYPLVIATRYNIPFMLNAADQDGAKNVHGEVYEVNEAALEKLDELECHPDFYTREVIQVRLVKSPESVKSPANESSHEVVKSQGSMKSSPENSKSPEILQCWCYLLRDFRLDLLKSDFFESYDAYGPHKLEYVAAAARLKGGRGHFWHEVKHSWPKPSHPDPSLSNRVFLYGTLKTGQPNHYALQFEDTGKVQYVGKAVTVETYPLVVGTEYNIPCLMKMEGKGKNIYGELCDVDSQKLAFLDNFEDHPNTYIREKILVHRQTDNNNTTANPPEPEEAWCYFFRAYDDSFLQKEFLDDYDTNGTHGLKYDEREAADCAKDLGLCTE